MEGSTGEKGKGVNYMEAKVHRDLTQLTQKTATNYYIRLKMVIARLHNKCSCNMFIVV